MNLNIMLIESFLVLILTILNANISNSQNNKPKISCYVCTNCSCTNYQLVHNCSFCQTKLTSKRELVKKCSSSTHIEENTYGVHFCEEDRCNTLDHYEKCMKGDYFCHVCNNCTCGEEVIEKHCKLCSTVTINQKIVKKSCMSSILVDRDNVTKGNGETVNACEGSLCNNESDSKCIIPKIFCNECDNCNCTNQNLVGNCKYCSIIKTNNGTLKKECVKEHNTLSAGIVKLCNKNLCNKDESDSKCITPKIFCNKCNNCNCTNQNVVGNCTYCSTVKTNNGILKKQCVKKQDTLPTGIVELCNKHLCNTHESDLSCNFSQLSCYECDDCQCNKQKTTERCRYCSTLIQNKIYMKKCIKSSATNNYPELSRPDIDSCFTNLCNNYQNCHNHGMIISISNLAFFGIFFLYLNVVY